MLAFGFSYKHRRPDGGGFGHHAGMAIPRTLGPLAHGQNFFCAPLVIKPQAHPPAVSSSGTPATLPTPQSSSCRTPLGGLHANMPQNSNLSTHKASERAVTSAASSTKALPAAKRGSGRLYLMKVLVVGNAKCGKTSIVRRLTSGAFKSAYNTTVGADFVRHDLEVARPNQSSQNAPRSTKDDENAEPLPVRLQLWDIAGQDRFAKMTRAYFRKAKAAAIVCDLTREGTFDAVRQWKHELDRWTAEELPTGAPPLPVVLFANKCDLLLTGAAACEAGAKMEALCRELDIAQWFVTSAKDGDNVEAGFQYLASLVLHRDTIGESTAAATAATTSAAATASSLPPQRSANVSSIPGKSSSNAPVVRMAMREPAVTWCSDEASEMVAEEVPKAVESEMVVLGSIDSGLLQVWDLDDF